MSKWSYCVTQALVSTLLVHTVNHVLAFSMSWFTVLCNYIDCISRFVPDQSNFLPFLRSSWKCVLFFIWMKMSVLTAQGRPHILWSESHNCINITHYRFSWAKLSHWGSLKKADTIKMHSLVKGKDCYSNCCASSKVKVCIKRQPVQMNR